MKITRINYNWHPTSDGTGGSGEDYLYDILGENGVKKIEHSPEMGKTVYSVTYEDGSEKIIFNPNLIHRKPIKA